MESETIYRPDAFSALLLAMECPRPRSERWQGESREVEAARRALKEQWLRSVHQNFPDGLIEANGNLCWQRLLGKHGAYSDRYDAYKSGLPGDDHVSIWRRPQDRGAKIALWVSQPYGLSAGMLCQMVAFAAEHGLEFDIGTWPAWHNPGKVLFVTWRAKPNAT